MEIVDASDTSVCNLSPFSSLSGALVQTLALMIVATIPILILSSYNGHTGLV